MTDNVCDETLILRYDESSRSFSWTEERGFKIVDVSGKNSSISNEVIKDVLIRDFGSLHSALLKVSILDLNTRIFQTNGMDYPPVALRIVDPKVVVSDSLSSVIMHLEHSKDKNEISDLFNTYIDRVDAYISNNFTDIQSALDRRHTILERAWESAIPSLVNTSIRNAFYLLVSLLVNRSDGEGTQPNIGSRLMALVVSLYGETPLGDLGVNQWCKIIFKLLGIDHKFLPNIVGLMDTTKAKVTTSLFLLYTGHVKDLDPKWWNGLCDPRSLIEGGMNHADVLDTIFKPPVDTDLAPKSLKVKSLNDYMTHGGNDGGSSYIEFGKNTNSGIWLTSDTHTKPLTKPLDKMSHSLLWMFAGRSVGYDGEADARDVLNPWVAHLVMDLDLELSIMFYLSKQNSYVVNQWVRRHYSKLKGSSYVDVKLDDGTVAKWQWYHHRIVNLDRQHWVRGEYTGYKYLYNKAREVSRIEGYEALNEDRTLPLFEHPLPTHITQLTTTRALVLEGINMHHCVGGYVNKCLEGKSFIFHVDDDTEYGATLELVRDGGLYRVSQCMGYDNEDKYSLAEDLELWVDML